MKKAFLAVLVLVGICLALVPVAFLIDTEERPAPETVPGFKTLSLTVEHRDAPLAGFVWYPAQAAGGALPELIGQNALFYGHHVLRDAPARAGSHPLIVVSHGSGGNAVQLGWLLADLANAGYVVAAVNHAGTTSRDSDPHRTPHVWDRTRDLSALIDAMVGGAGPATVDPSRIGVLGFSLGGHGALGLSGARLSKPAFLDYCERNAGKVDCGWMQAAGVDFDAIDQALYEADYRDGRVSATVAIDPALTQAMTSESLGRIATSPLLVNLGAPGDLPEAVRADGIARQIPGARHVAIQGAAHFTMLPECSLLGVVVIGVAGEDNICSDRGLRPRAEVHPEITALVRDYFDRSLQPDGIAN